MFENEILRSSCGMKIAWYAEEKICLVFNGKSVRTYDKIPKKYRTLFEDGTKRTRRKNESRIRD